MNNDVAHNIAEALWPLIPQTFLILKTIPEGTDPISCAVALLIAFAENVVEKSRWVLAKR